MSMDFPLSRRDLLRVAGATGVGALVGASNAAGAPNVLASPPAAKPPKDPAHPPATIHEPAREIPVVDECDLCVIGGSSTGVFAAVAAARLGARVALVENLGLFGRCATSCGSTSPGAGPSA